MNASFRRRITVAVIDDDADATRAMRVLPSVPATRRSVLATLLIAGLTIFPRSMPGAAEVEKPALQPMAQLDFRPPMWGMPDATTWTHMDFSIAKIEPGKSFDTNKGWYTSTDGPFLIVVLSGVLDIDPNGPAIVYPADHTKQPQPIDAGASTSLGTNDAIAFSIADAAVGANPGTEPLLALFALTGSEDFSEPGAFSMPIDISYPDFQYVDEMPVLPTAGATVSIQRVELQPYDSFVFDPGDVSHYLPALDPNQTHGLHLAAGVVDEWSPGLETLVVRSSSVLMYPVLGPHTLFALGDEPVDLYFFFVEPYPLSATPTP